MKIEEKYEEAKELRVRIENVNFHTLIVPHLTNYDVALQEPLLHKHVFYELFVCGKGELQIKTASGNVLLKQNDIAIIPPTEPHVLHYLGKDAEGYTIPFMCKRIKDSSYTDLYKKIHSIVGDEILIYKNYPGFFAKVKKTIEGIISDKSKHFQETLHLFELLFELSQALPESNIPKPVDYNLESVSNDIQSMMVIDGLIANGYQQKYSASDFANKLFISTRQLDRILNKHYGKSLHKLILDKRFDHAQQLLLTTNLSVEAVATKAGFSSSASFYRESKKRYGMTPAELRKKGINSSEKNS